MKNGCNPAPTQLPAVASAREFRKKPVVIQAIQYTGKNFADILAFVGDTLLVQEFSSDDPLDKYVMIRTLEDRDNTASRHIASIGDLIIRGVQGEFYPCKPDIFAQTYETLAAYGRNRATIAAQSKALLRVLDSPGEPDKWLQDVRFALQAAGVEFRVKTAIERRDELRAERDKAATIAGLREALRETSDLLKQMAVLCYDKRVQPYIPGGVEEDVKAWLRSTKTEAALAASERER